MLGSLLSTLTVSALVLAVPASVGLLTMGRHAHVAVVDAAARRLGLVAAATLSGLGALGVSALTGSGPFQAMLVASVLAGSVLAWARRLGAWEIRGVVAWAMSSTGAIGLAGWMAERILADSAGGPELVTGGAAWLVLVVAMTRLRSRVRGLFADRAVRGQGPEEEQEGGGFPVPAMLALVASAGVLAAVIAGGTWPGFAPSPVAGTSTDPSGGASPSPSSKATVTATRSASGASGSRRASATGEPAVVDGHAGESGATRAGPDDPTTTSSPTPTDVRSPAASSTPEATQATKTPGYAKDNPNRPSHAATPGPESSQAP